MPAYVVVDIDIQDPVLYAEYIKLTPATLAAYDGRFAVRGGKTEVVEGEWQQGRFVIPEFPTVERAKEWWDSSEYTPAKKIRQAAAHTNMIVVQGV